MRGKKPRLNGVVIERVAAEGKALAHVDDKVLFVQNMVPGDVVDVQVTKLQRNYMEGYPVRLVTPSPMRIEPFCPHFGVCGGCKWQHLPYEKQLEFKQQEVTENLRRIGHLTLPEISPILASDPNRFYRNKLEYTCTPRRFFSTAEIAAGEKLEHTPAIGFHAAGLFDKVVDVERCELQKEPSNALRNFLRAYVAEHGTPLYDIRSQSGFLRTVIVRTSVTGEVMVIMTFGREDKELREPLMEAVAEHFPEITSLLYVINEKGNDTITDQEIHLFRGEDHIFGEMEDLRFKIGPKSFYQTNDMQAYRLYSTVRTLADVQPDETLYDLYTGTGTIALFLARMAKHVVGIEYVAEAIEDAKVNASLNHIDNADFFAGDVRELFNAALFHRFGKPKVLVTDPPRSGMHPDVVAAIIEAAPERVVYVSCNSSTQARDLALMDASYEILAVQPVDMFPHTHHVENVVLLRHR